MDADKAIRVLLGLALDQWRDLKHLERERERLAFDNEVQGMASRTVLLDEIGGQFNNLKAERQELLRKVAALHKEIELLAESGTRDMGVRPVWPA